MERRNFLKSTGASAIGEALGVGGLLGAFSPLVAFARGTTTPQPPPSLGGGLRTLSADLSPYTGAWGDTQLRHLLRRAMFGVPESQFVAAQALGSMDAVVTQLLACQNLTNDPLPSLLSPTVTWPNNFPTNYPAGSNNALNQATLMAYEVIETVNWWFDQMMQENLSIRQKMTLMWTNHFVTGSATVNIPAYVYTYLITCMKNALGNFKNFASAISIDPAMLLYLNGNQNYVINEKNGTIKPYINENYARELMELFTLGINFPGTSTPNYTQDDVENNARALTGWRPTITAPFVGQFNSALHDSTNKTFLGQTGKWALSDVIDIIFQQPTASYPPGAPSGFPQGYTAAYWACQTIYKTFVYYNPNITDPNGTVRDAMARLMLSPPNPYKPFDIAPVLQAMLTSAHFYDPSVIGAQIKSPAEFAGSLVREFGLTYPTFVPTDPSVKGQNSQGLDEYTDTNPALSYLTNAIMNNSQGQQLLNPPNVAGWPGGENWLSAGSFQGRQNFSNAILNKKTPLTFNENTYADQIANAGTLAEGVLFSDLENVSLEFTLGPIESGALAPDPSKTDDVIGTQVPSFAPAMAQLPEFQLF
ncbi:MAG TPA: DUF1800 family protein [Candidatus Kapabacteria bacterium]|nr:DUF1800 family protein [Candidatus Kapabacteria bacterium]